MLDLHIVLEKWFLLAQGTPMVPDFGRGWYLQEMDEAAEAAGCKDFLRNKPTFYYPAAMSFHKNIPNRLDKMSSRLWRKRIWRKY